jgi:HD superfamily phosphohydrolase
LFRIHGIEYRTGVLEVARPRNIWDAVWGQIELTEEEWLVINTPAFQRLRRVHQLALTMLVFPGATHTRFEHSLGTRYVADRICKRLLDLSARGESATFDEADARIVRLAALLHDLGHGPFSHVSDPFLNRATDRGHEWIGAMAIEHLPEFRDVLDKDVAGTSRAIGDILLARGSRTIGRDIVSGPTDADKVDYLLRDSQATGVRGGHFDHDYLIDQLVGIQSIGESWLGFRWGGVWAVEGLKLARYHMFRTVYTHRNRVVTDVMLERALQAAIGTVLPADLLTLPPEEEFVEWFRRYESYDDWRVFALGIEADNSAGRMFRRLRDHKLLKVLVFLEGEEFKRLLGTEYARLLVASKDRHAARACEAELADALSFEAEDVIVELIDPRHVLYRDPLRLDEDINFVTKDGSVEPFAERSEIFSAQPADRWRRQLLVYAPVGRRDAPEVANLAQDRVLELLRKVLAEGR